MQLKADNKRMDSAIAQLQTRLQDVEGPLSRLSLRITHDMARKKLAFLLDPTLNESTWSGFSWSDFVTKFPMEKARAALSNDSPWLKDAQILPLLYLPDKYKSFRSAGSRVAHEAEEPELALAILRLPDKPQRRAFLSLHEIVHGKPADFPRT
ncbi:hypothetical protein DACRYDRAFT_107389 [Dacryopinax primogenitus]|nr:uncharacterized protein DACRYDRAFT_107389 [Dacryopinax primogenitus]EJU02472.1 hypothetical protein DACRYDRAFT_107389 [Dacryopinax primogenitus]